MSAHTPIQVSESRRSAILVVCLAFLAFVVLGIPGGMLGVAWPSIRDLFALSHDQVGTLLITSQIGYITFSFLSGHLTASFGNGRILTLGAFLTAIGLVGYAIAPSWLIMVAIGLLVGSGGGAIDAGMNAFFAMNYGPRLMNWLHASFGLGATLGPLLLTGLLLAGTSWRWGYVAAAITQVVIALLFLSTRSYWALRGLDDDDENQRPTSVPHPPPAAHIEVWLGVLIFFCIAGLEMNAGQWSFTLFTESRGVDVGTAGAWVSIYWGSFTAGRIVFGIAGNHIPVLPALRACMALLIVASLMLWWQGPHIVAFIGLALMGFALAPLFPLLMTATPKRLGRRRAATVIGYQVAAASMGIALLPGLNGLLAELRSLEVTGPVLLIGSVALLALHEILQARRPLPPTAAT